MRCDSCGYDNPSGSVYCQQCGSRLAAEGASAAGGVGARFGGAAAAPTPVAAAPAAERVSAPAAPAAAPARKDGKTCPRCDASNAPHMRFCVECGTPFDGPAAQPEAFSGPPVSEPATAPDPSPAPAAEASAKPSAATPVGHSTVVHAAPQPAHAPARLVAILKDGSDGRVFPLAAESTDVGRSEGDVQLADDPYLSDRHARIAQRGDRWVLNDLDSVNGIYVRIREPVDLTSGDMILIGQQVLRFEALPDAELPLGPASIQGVLAFGTPEVPRIARLLQYTTEGVGRDVHYLYRDETVLGRENGDVVFTDDPFLSRRHAAITIDRTARRFVLRDLGSSNGTAIRFKGERVLGDGDQFRIGRHLFRFDILGQGHGG